MVGGIERKSHCYTGLISFTFAISFSFEAFDCLRIMSKAPYAMQERFFGGPPKLNS